MAASQSAGCNIRTLPRDQVMERRINRRGNKKGDGRHNRVMLHNTINFQHLFDVHGVNLLLQKKRSIFAGQHQ